MQPKISRKCLQPNISPKYQPEKSTGRSFDTNRIRLRGL